MSNHIIMCQDLHTQAERLKKNHFTMDEQGILVRMHPSRGHVEIVVPEKLRPRVLLAHHSSAVAGHPGVRRMYNTLTRGYYWPTMIVDEHATVRACETCARDRMQFIRHTNPLKLFPAKLPLFDVAIDIMGPLPKTTHGKLYICLLYTSPSPRDS